MVHDRRNRPEASYSTGSLADKFVVEISEPVYRRLQVSERRCAVGSGPSRGALGMMRRRELISGLLLAGAARHAWGQQPKRVYRIAYVHPARPVATLKSSVNDPEGNPAFWMFEELRRMGYVEGRNVEFTFYSAGGDRQHYAAVADEVVRLKPDLIVTTGTAMAKTLRGATTTIPIVANTGDPVAEGLVANMARPGGNVTGVSVETGPEIFGKRLSLLKEAVPGFAKLGHLAAPPAAEEDPELVAAREWAQRTGVSIVSSVPNGRFDEEDYRRQFADLSSAGVDALFINSTPTHLANLRLVVELVKQTGLPAIYAYREFVQAGGLMAYGVDPREIYGQMAIRVDQILRGTNPGEIPYYQPTKFVFSINLKTANRLGLTLPQLLLAQADEVIE
jgi:putative ABC transport system substrate-binding protein